MTPEESRLVAWGVEMRAVHNRLRAALSMLQESTEPGAPLDRELLLHCQGFCTALSRHHSSEDNSLFPELERRHPNLADVLRKLRQDHSMMAHLITELDHARQTATTSDQLARHMDGIGAIMESHFRYEERQLLGVLDALDLDAEVTEVLGPF